MPSPVRNELLNWPPNVLGPFSMGHIPFSEGCAPILHFRSLAVEADSSEGGARRLPRPLAADYNV